MSFSSGLIEEVVLEFSRLPGIGKKTAFRLALHLLKQDEGDSKRLGEAILRMRREICYCSRCHNVSDETICLICKDKQRQHGTVCVVESIREVMAIEATQQYRGLYHVLGGLISPLDGIGPEKLEIASLMKRVEEEGIQELIFAISPTMEGDTTSYYISRKLAHVPVRITTLSRGVAFGSELEYADELTLARALLNRVPVEQVVHGPI